MGALYQNNNFTEKTPGTTVVMIDDPGARYHRLSHFIIEFGTHCIRRFVIQNVPMDNQTFEQIIKRNRNVFNQIRNSRGINATQFHILYPPDGSDVDIVRIDLSLWIVIGRNLAPKAMGISESDWKNEPSNSELNPGHDFIRIRNIRNRIAHLPNSELGESLYHETWNELSSAFQRLGATNIEINKYKECDLDPEMTRKYVDEIKDQCLKDYKYTITEFKDYIIFVKNSHHRLLIKCSVIFGIVFVLTLVIVIVSFILTRDHKKSCRDYIENLPTEDAVIYYMPRDGWGANPPINDPTNKLLQPPVKHIIVSVTGFIDGSASIEESCSSMRKLQQFCQEQRGFADTAYSYVVGNDGVIYEGRGTDLRPATARGWNHDSVSIAFMGAYAESGKPSDNAIQAAYNFVFYLIKENIVVPDVIIYGLCQVREKFPHSPGPEVMGRIQHWKGEKWGWRNRTGGFCSHKIS